jgi:hypothetical protein
MFKIQRVKIISKACLESRYVLWVGGPSEPGGRIVRVSLKEVCRMLFLQGSKVFVLRTVWAFGLDRP